MQASIKDAGRHQGCRQGGACASQPPAVFSSLLLSFPSPAFLLCLYLSPSQLCQYPSCRVVSYLLWLLYTLLVLPIPYPKALVMLLPGHPFTSPHLPSLPQLTLYPPSPRLMSDSVAPPATFQTPFI